MGSQVNRHAGERLMGARRSANAQPGEEVVTLKTFPTRARVVLVGDEVQERAGDPRIEDRAWLLSSEPGDPVMVVTQRRVKVRSFRSPPVVALYIVRSEDGLDRFVLVAQFLAGDAAGAPQDWFRQNYVVPPNPAEYVERFLDGDMRVPPGDERALLEAFVARHKVAGVEASTLSMIRCGSLAYRTPGFAMAFRRDTFMRVEDGRIVGRLPTSAFFARQFEAECFDAPRDQTTLSGMDSEVAVVAPERLLREAKGEVDG